MASIQIISVEGDSVIIERPLEGRDIANRFFRNTLERDYRRGTVTEEWDQADVHGSELGKDYCELCDSDGALTLTEDPQNPGHFAWICEPCGDKVRRDYVWPSEVA